jgi:hypothetical protein
MRDREEQGKKVGCRKCQLHIIIIPAGGKTFGTTLRIEKDKRAISNSFLFLFSPSLSLSLSLFLPFLWAVTHIMMT